MKFTKMHGLGNDYVYIDCYSKEVNLKDISNLAKFMSNRHFGIGSDGIILICKSDVADFKMRMFNSDGSEAEMCGNGIRCVGKFVYDKGLTTKQTLKIETLAGAKILKLNITNQKVETVTVDMGEPIFEPKKIPVKYSQTPVKNLKIKVLDKDFNFTCVSMGNPHAVTIVDNISQFDVEKYGAVLEKNEHFPQKSNIEFIEIIDKNNIKMRVWERGAGETLACGTGACAVAIASNINELTNEKVNIELLGGILNINWDKKTNHVFMTGAATTVFEGQIDL
ncbi:MAG: diaminopimelate epimerase [Clostridia bacterium]|nr:diaminopimelate epimerase [Clostridia bacterium]